nr:2-amino-4-hydroxy-6-hydroxymethyldihydropteridine diphosphokinase [Tsuneonella rigui]
MTAHRYLIALGSNMRHARHGGPREVLRAAVGALADVARVEAVSPIVSSAPLGPSRRRYANAAAIVSTNLAPEDLLDALHRIEHAFGRRCSGQDWRARVLDLDIVLWSGGAWASRRLVVPHSEFRTRAFVLAPARAIAADWGDPVTGQTIRHLHARLTRARALP